MKPAYQTFHVLSPASLLPHGTNAHGRALRRGEVIRLMVVDVQPLGRVVQYRNQHFFLPSHANRALREMA